MIESIDSNINSMIQSIVDHTKIDLDRIYNTDLRTFDKLYKSTKEANKNNSSKLKKG